MTKSSLIFCLSQNLKIYRLTKQKLVLIDQVIPENGFLNLDKEFENLWQKLWPIITLEKEIFYLILPGASFTSSRIIFLWLQSWQMFASFGKASFEKPKEISDELGEQNSQKNKANSNKANSNNISVKKFYTDNLSYHLALEVYQSGFLEISTLQELLAKIRHKNNQKLIYSGQVRIGT